MSAALPIMGRSPNGPDLQATRMIPPRSGGKQVPRSEWWPVRLCNATAPWQRDLEGLSTMVRSLSGCLENPFIMNSKTASYLMLVTGLAAGTVIGLLLAPEKGKDTRERIIRKGRDLFDRVREHAEKTTSNGGHHSASESTGSSRRRSEGTATS